MKKLLSIIAAVFALTTQLTAQINDMPSYPSWRQTKKLIVFDLDGTLTQHKTPLTPENKAVLDELGKRYSLLMAGGGGCERIYRQMNCYPIPILGNYGMEESEVVNGEFKIIREEKAKISKRAFTRKCMKLRKKYGYMDWKGEPLEFHESGMVTFGLLGTKADKADKLAFDPDKMKRRAMLPEVSKVFSNSNVIIGGTTSFDITPKKYNKYRAVMRYATEHGFTKDQILFVGDDLDDGGNDSHIRIGGIDYVRIYDFTTLPEKLKFLYKSPQ